MIIVGIDVASDKHDCYIMDSSGKTIHNVFTIPNNRIGYDLLFQKIKKASPDIGNVKVGLESTGHYSNNILTFLIGSNLTVYLLNPLHTSMYRKSLSLRKAKTDKIDAQAIARFILSTPNLKPYFVSSYHKERLKALTRYRFTRVKARNTQKVELNRWIILLFPEFNSAIKKLNSATAYALLKRFPGAKIIGRAHINTIAKVIAKSSQGRFGIEKAKEIKELAQHSVGQENDVYSKALQIGIANIERLNKEIRELEEEMSKELKFLDEIITTIPGIGEITGAAIIAEIRDFSLFNNSDQILAFAGMIPSTYQSGHVSGRRGHMEKRGSKYLRTYLFNAAKTVCLFEPSFKAYLQKKRDEGKCYNVAITHAARKLVRLIFAMEQTHTAYKTM